MLSRKKIFNILLALLMVASLGNLYANSNKSNIDDLINNYQNVPLEEKIAQMLLVGFEGETINSEIRSYIEKYKIGGVVLFNRNIENPNQVRKLNQAMQKLSDVTLFIALDQEGGRIARLNENNGFSETMSHQELGMSNNLNKTYEEANKIAKMLQRYGFNYNFAPSVDVNINPTNPIIGSLERSFSSDKEEVYRQANAYIQAHNHLKIITSLKHFPGHGSSTKDTHKGFVDITKEYNEDVELYPYQQAFKNNYNGTVMVAHVVNKKVDSQYPASLSKKYITTKLRQTLGFEGVIITDDLKMKAIEDYWTLEQSLVLTINAGSNIIIYSNNLGTYNPTFVEDAIAIIKKNIFQGKIDAKLIDDSYLRIMKLKKEFLY